MFTNIKESVQAAIDYVVVQSNNLQKMLSSNIDVLSDLFMVAAIVGVTSGVILAVCIGLIITIPIVIWILCCALVAAITFTPFVMFGAVIALTVAVPVFFVILSLEEGREFLTSVFTNLCQEHTNQFQESLGSIFAEEVEETEQEQADSTAESTVATPQQLWGTTWKQPCLPSAKDESEALEEVHEILHQQLKAVAERDALVDIAADAFFQSLAYQGSLAYEASVPLDYIPDFWVEEDLYLPEIDDCTTAVTERRVLILPPQRHAFPRRPESKDSLMRKTIKSLKTLCSDINKAAENYENIPMIEDYLVENISRQQLTEKIWNFYQTVFG